MNVTFGGASSASIATASLRGNEMTIYDGFFQPNIGMTQSAVIMHEGLHGVGISDQNSAPNFGRFSPNYPTPLGSWLAEGRSGSNWLAANHPERTFDNVDSYTCFVSPTSWGN